MSCVVEQFGRGGDLVRPFPWIRNERRLADPGNKNYKAGGGDLVQPSPRIRIEQRPPSPACVRPFKSHFWWGDTVECEIKEESYDAKQKQWKTL